jgi:hypothetical protein
MPGTTIGRGNILYNFLIGPNLTPASVAGSTAIEQSFTVAGIQVGDVLDVNTAVAQTAGITIGNVRAALNTIIIQFANSTAAPLTPAAGIHNINIERPENVPLPVNAV